MSTPKPNMMCKLFGHKAPNNRRYGRLHVRSIDGIGRLHGDVSSKCERCDTMIWMCQVHIPTRDFRVEKRDVYYEFVRDRHDPV